MSDEEVRKAAVALIQRGDGRVLCVWNKRYDGFSLPGGMIEDGESPMEGLRRELREETSLEVDKAVLIFAGSHDLRPKAGDRGGRASVVMLYRVTASGVPQESEAGCRVEWLTWAEFLVQSPFREFYRRILPSLSLIKSTVSPTLPASPPPPAPSNMDERKMHNAIVDLLRRCIDETKDCPFCLGPVSAAEPDFHHYDHCVTRQLSVASPLHQPSRSITAEETSLAITWTKMLTRIAVDMPNSLKSAAFHEAVNDMAFEVHHAAKTLSVMTQISDGTTRTAPLTPEQRATLEEAACGSLSESKASSQAAPPTDTNGSSSHGVGSLSKQRPHLIDGKFQSDKYPTTPRGLVPISVKDKTAQDLLWTYAQRRRVVDADFADDLEAALGLAGYVSPVKDTSLVSDLQAHLKHHKLFAEEQQIQANCRTLDPADRKVHAARANRDTLFVAKLESFLQKATRA